MAMTLSQSKSWRDQTYDLIDNVTYPGYTFRVHDCAGGVLVHAGFQAQDNDNPGNQHLYWHNTRRWFIETGTSMDGVACTILKLVLCSLEHEAREQLRFDGEAVFHPHKPLDFGDGQPNRL